MNKSLRLLAAVALGLPAVTLAGPSDYVRVPGVEYGATDQIFTAPREKLTEDYVTGRFG